MDDPKKSASLQELGKRLAAARGRQQGGRGGRSRAVSSEGMGAGLRIAVEMLAALVVGIGLGLLLDHWLGTRPWLLLLGFVLGSGGAFANVVRTARQLEAEQKLRREAERRGKSGSTDRVGRDGKG